MGRRRSFGWVVSRVQDSITEPSGGSDEMGEGDSAYYTLGLPSALESLDGEAVAIHVAWVPKKTGETPQVP